MLLRLHGARGEARGGGREMGPLEGSVRPHWAPHPQHGNFEESQETMKRQLGQLLLLLRVLDPPLCDFLGMSLGGWAAPLPVSTQLEPGIGNRFLCSWGRDSCIPALKFLFVTCST